MRKLEYHHNEDEQVRGYIERALELVAELDPPDDLRVIAFQKACDLYASKQVIYEQVGALPAGIGGRLSL